MTAIITLASVAKSFGATTAVDAISLAIHEGEFFALLGPSGCGKTTLLRLLAGFESPDSGQIEIDGRDMTATPPNRRPVNMVFQNHALFPHMTTAQNIGYGLKVSGIAAPEVRTRVAAALALVKLDDLGHRRPDQLSGGQRQRVALARALVMRPRVLLLDEPLSALDTGLRAAMRAELIDLQRTVGITFVMVTHDQDEALSLATRCAVMRAGRVEQVATPAQLYEAPASRFVAGFIGAVNLLEAKVIGVCNGDTLLGVEGFANPVRCATPAGQGARVCLAIRPERCELHPRGPHAAEPPAGHNREAGTIHAITYLGSERRYVVELGNARRIEASRPNRGPTDLATGQPVWLSWPPGAATLLPP